MVYGDFMRNIIASNYVTLDGFFAGPNGELDWFVWDDQMGQYAKDLLGSVDTILFGRVTYELMAGYWPTAAAPEEDPIITDAMNDLPKIVFSRTLAKADWKNTRLIKEINKDQILKMKQQPGKDIVIFGSGSIVSTFTRWGLIDDYRFLVNPVILGGGKPLFKGITDRINLKLLENRRFDSGAALLRYQPGVTIK
ncbi:MAG: dihydrofolate reductase family protein [Methanothrix sp.]|nr:dihydrofolate reductase family protein [Methanothrix sp.]